MTMLYVHSKGTFSIWPENINDKTYIRSNSVLSFYLSENYLRLHSCDFSKKQIEIENNKILYIDHKFRCYNVQQFNSDYKLTTISPIKITLEEV